MSDKEKVPQFWDKGIQLVDGCTKVSPGCANCWSEAMTARFRRVPDVLTGDRFNGTVQFNLHLLEKAAKVKKPTVYAIWNDLYHEGVTDEQRDMAFAAMAMADHHIYLVITKRIESAARYWTGSDLPDPSYRALGIALRAVKMGLNEPLRDKFVNLVHEKMWTISTCENQAMADKRIPHLLRIPGKRAIIIEPMLSAMHFHKKGWQRNRYCCYICDIPWFAVENKAHLDGIHQVILGPENGPGKRPFDPAWAESIKAQCEAAGVPFYRKDTGEGTLTWR